MHRWRTPILYFRVGFSPAQMCVSRSHRYICLVRAFHKILLLFKDFFLTSLEFLSWTCMKKNQEVNSCFQSNVLLIEWGCKLLNCVWLVWPYKSLLEEIVSRCIVTRVYWKSLQSGEECACRTLNLFPLKVSFVAKEVKQWLCYGVDSSAKVSYFQNKAVQLLRMM